MTQYQIYRSQNSIQYLLCQVRLGVENALLDVRVNVVLGELRVREVGHPLAAALLQIILGFEPLTIGVTAHRSATGQQVPKSTPAFCRANFQSFSPCVKFRRELELRRNREPKAGKLCKFLKIEKTNHSDKNANNHDNRR